MRAWFRVSEFCIQVLTTVSIKANVFWDVTPCSLVDAFRNLRVNEFTNLDDGDRVVWNSNNLQQDYIAAHTRVDKDAVSSTLMMELVGSPKKSVNLWKTTQSLIHSFHSIGMCRIRRFLAVLRNFFHSSLLWTFPATLPLQLFFHPLSPHLAIYFLVCFSILLFPNSYITLFWELYFLPFSVHVQTNLIWRKEQTNKMHKLILD